MKKVALQDPTWYIIGKKKNCIWLRSGENNCLVDFENTAAFSRRYQSIQDCMCDTEHMADCSSNSIGNSGLPGMRISNSDFDRIVEFQVSRRTFELELSTLFYIPTTIFFLGRESVLPGRKITDSCEERYKCGLLKRKIYKDVIYRAFTYALCSMEKYYMRVKCEREKERKPCTHINLFHINYLKFCWIYHTLKWSSSYEKKKKWYY